MLESAIELAELGYPVFPCVPGAKRPATANGLKDATTDVARIEAFWTAHPAANVAIATEGLFVLDVDGADNPWLTPDRAIDLARGVLSLTPSGGRHYIFRQPAGASFRNTAGKLAPKIDTRANGGYILVAPSVVDGKAYRWAEGNSLDQSPEKLSEPPRWLLGLLDGAHGDGASVRSDQPIEANTIPDGQRNHTLASLAGSMRRIGMSKDEIQAALWKVNLDRCKPPLPPNEVETIAWSIARHEPDQLSVAVAEGIAGVDLSELAPSDTAPMDPGPIPESLLKVPGFISDVMAYTLETAPYPQPVLAFGGALALQAFLASRKVCDQADNRTSLYLATLASSGAGKDHPRKIIQRILGEVGLGHCVGDSMASAEGLEDALFVTPSFIILADEIDSLLRAIKSGKDARHEGIMNILLRLYTSSNRSYTMRLKAGRERLAIDNPGLTLYATGIPTRFYGAVSPQMIENGFLARLMILEAGERGEGQEPINQDPPDSIIRAAKYWAELSPGGTNLAHVHPVPRLVEATGAAMLGLRTFRAESETEWDRTDSEAAKAIWARVAENARRLALNYACSANYENPEITAEAVEWAVSFARHQAKRMLFMAGAHVAENEFAAKCNRYEDVLRRWKAKTSEDWMPFFQLSRRLKGWSPREFEDVGKILIAQGKVERRVATTSGRPRETFRLR